MNNFFNRELSWLSFNYRVLQEAKDETVPLYERIKFLAIYSSNLDEFFRVRVASLRSLLRLKKKSQKKLKFNPEELLRKIHKTVNVQQEEFGKIYREQIIPLLEKENIFIVDLENLNSGQKNFLEDFYEGELKPHLQPILLDKKIETFLQNKAIYIAARLTGLKTNYENTNKKRFRYALIEVPSGKFGRFIVLPREGDRKFIIFLDDVVKLSLQDLFPGYRVESLFSVKLTRDAELYIDDEFTGNLLEKIKKGLSKRKTGAPSRFLYDSKMPKDFLKYLRNCLNLGKDDLIPGGKYHNYNDFFSFPNPIGKHLEYEPMIPVKNISLEKHSCIFDAIKERDIFLHYPYNSYDYVIRFIDEASEDANTDSVYITLYRVASGSKVIKTLSRAASNGKKVIAFVEVKARFDEESNFSYAEELQKAGVQVFYSFPGLKVHAKICLINRLENGKKTSYCYFSTGNFNEKTAGIYSDFGLFTKDERLTNEAAKVFDVLTKQKGKESFNNLLVAPFNLRSTLEKLIDKEIENALSGKEAYIILKMNSLEDRKMIKLLYKASGAGVKIKLITRGICCLIPDKNIKAISIVDRYLEHSRVFIFCSGGEKKIFISSADWMTRNLSRRIEVCFPVYEEDIKKRIWEIINIQLNDNVKARIINRFQNNRYRTEKSGKKIRAQYEIYSLLQSN